MMADMQRVRQIAGELPAQGWNVEILAPDASFQTDFSRIQGEDLAFPDVPAHPVHPWQPGLFARLGSRNIGIRASIPLRRRGAQLCRESGYDLVYFSTNQHWLTCQGAVWRRMTGIPYVADLHDPVYLEKKVYFVSRHRIKERIARHLGKTIERLALGRADGLVSVSQGYIDDVARRIPAARWLRGRTTMVEGFPADLEGLMAARAEHREAGGRKRVVYVGAGGNIMENGWLQLVACLREAGEGNLPLVELHGTDSDWRVNKRLYLQNAAEGAGLRGVAEEYPARISYEQSLSLAKGADGLLVLGVDDPNYRPSKLQTYLATGLPVLAVVHAKSLLVEKLTEHGPGVYVVRFGVAGFRAENERSVAEFLQALAKGRRWSPQERHILTAAESAAHHARFFDRVAGEARSR
jgi:glycosyltransferase involved in cell wall biosynthesis